MNDHSPILLAEDDEVDVMLLQRAFAAAELRNPIEVARDGQYAIEFLERRLQDPLLPLPGLVLLDLKMPRRDGLQTLQWMRSQAGLRCVPAIIFSSSAHRLEVRRAYEAGASAFLVKPPSLQERTEVARFIKEWVRLNQVVPCEA